MGERKHPAYVRIADQIKEEWLRQPGAKSGQKLPTQHELSERYGASLPTIAKALSVLAADGLIETRQGSGSYIHDSPHHGEMPKLITFVAQLTYDWLGVRTYNGVARRAREKGYHLLTASSTFSVEQEQKLVEDHIASGAMGVILSPAVRRRDELEDDYLTQRWQEVPIVTIDVGYEEWGRSMIVFDNYQLGYDITTQLLERGHRNIAMMQISDEWLWSSIHQRKQGWMDALDDAGVAPPPSYDGWAAEFALEDFLLGKVRDFEPLARSVLALDPLPDAVIAWEDMTAMQLMRALMRVGVKIPEDIRVTGFDGHDSTEYFHPRFPSSLPDFSRAGELAVDILHNIITGHTTRPRTYILPVPVTWREPENGPVRVEEEEVVQEDIVVQETTRAVS